MTNHVCMGLMEQYFFEPNAVFPASYQYRNGLKALNNFIIFIVLLFPRYSLWMTSRPFQKNYGHDLDIR